MYRAGVSMWNQLVFRQYKIKCSLTKTFKTIKSIDNIQKTQTQRLSQYLGLSQPEHNRIFQVSCSHMRTKWFGIRMQWTEKITVKMVLEKSKVFSLGKCIKCHLYKQKYLVCWLQFLQHSPQKIQRCRAGVPLRNQLALLW